MIENQAEKIFTMGEVLEDLMTKKHKSNKELASHLGVSSQRVGQMVRQKEFKREVVEKLSAFFKVDKSVFYKGNTSIYENQQETHRIPFYNALVKAGSPPVYNDEVHEEIEYYIPGFQDCDLMVPVSGDSMYPDYSSGDIIICKKVDTELFIQWGHAHLVDTIQGLVLKILMPDENPQMVKMVSANPKFPPYQIPKNEIKSFYIVKGKLKKNLI